MGVVTSVWVTKHAAGLMSVIMTSATADLENAMKDLPDIPAGGALAAGVSGGPDSMALLWLLSQKAAREDFTIYAYTVDHALRPESGDEASQVGRWVEGWPHVRHRILRWEGAKPESRILEEARHARYALLEQAMIEDGAQHLAIAHHRDDQAETFLIRLAKGSGLDGLAGMNPLQKMGEMTLVRPLLDIAKDDLVAMCRDNDIPYVDDPTNKNDHYLRPRLRAAQAVLEEEGLSAKRLAVTARRLARARSALEDLSHDLYIMALLEQKTGGFLFDFKALHAAPEELVLRVLLRAMDQLRPDADYGPRLEKLENLLARILKDDAFKGATLGGCIFAKDIRRETLWVGKE